MQDKLFESLAGAEHRAAGASVALSVIDRSGRVLNDDCNVYGIARAIAQDLIDSIQFDGVNVNDWTYTVKMEPR